jgi:hypothetical protein
MRWVKPLGGQGCEDESRDAVWHGFLPGIFRRWYSLLPGLEQHTSFEERANGRTCKINN